MGCLKMSCVDCLWLLDFLVIQWLPSSLAPFSYKLQYLLPENPVILSFLEELSYSLWFKRNFFFFFCIVVQEGDACLHIGAAMHLSLSMSSRAVGWDFRGEIRSHKAIETVTLLHLRASSLFLSSGSLSSLVRHLHLTMQKSTAGSWGHSESPRYNILELPVYRRWVSSPVVLLAPLQVDLSAFSPLCTAVSCAAASLLPLI